MPIIDSIAVKLDKVRSRLQCVGTESIPVESVRGRILATDITAFRDSPSCDVSAMDGYALRLIDLRQRTLSISGIAKAGMPPLTLAPGTAVQIFTGAAVPIGAECIIQREMCRESPESVSEITNADEVQSGQHIRRRGENAMQSDRILGAGVEVAGQHIAGLATFADSLEVEVFRKVKVAIINTGDELVPYGQPIQEWQIRDSNGPLLESILSRFDWCEVTRTKVSDDLDSITNSIRSAQASADVVLLTGGVSMGDTDYVPQAIEGADNEIVFHRIPIRPGRPLLAATSPRGQLILGLPGNPISVAVTFRRFGLELIRYVAGCKSPTVTPKVQVHSGDQKQIDLVWFRLVTIQSDGTAIVLPSQGSGDLAALAQSDGFVEVPPNAPSSGLRSYYAW